MYDGMVYSLSQDVRGRYVTASVTDEACISTATLSHCHPPPADPRQSGQLTVYACTNQKISTVRPTASQCLWMTSGFTYSVTGLCLAYSACNEAPRQTLEINHACLGIVGMV